MRGAAAVLARLAGWLPGPLGVALATTGLAVLLLAWGEDYSPPGTAWAWLIMLLLIAGHWGLVRGAGDPAAPARGGWMPSVVVAGVLALAAMSLGGRHVDQVFRDPIDPLSMAHMGLMDQVTARAAGGLKPLYSRDYPRQWGWERNRFAPGTIGWFCAARAAGMDPRLGNGVALVLAAGLMAAAWAVAVGRGAGWGAGAAVVLGAAWMATGPPLGILNWAVLAPIWPLVAGLGLAMATGRVAVAMGLGAALALANPGWIVMMPVLGAWGWATAGRRALPWMGLLVVGPLLVAGWWRSEWESLLMGVLGGPFLEGAGIATGGTAGRYPSFHALGDAIGLRPALYVMGLVAAGAIAWRLATVPMTAARRLEWVALAAFVVLAAGPATFAFHWYSHACLLVGLLPGVLPAPAAAPAPARAMRRALMPVAVTALAAAPLVSALWGGVPGVLNRRPAGWQPHYLHLVSGFSVPGEDHVWGTTRHLVTGFHADRRTARRLDIHLTALQGDFTPYNPAVIRVNGRPAALFMAQPGRSRLAAVPLAPGDLRVGFNTVEIETAWTRTPASLGLGDDTRTLSIRYDGLRLLTE